MSTKHDQQSPSAQHSTHQKITTILKKSNQSTRTKPKRTKKVTRLKF